MSRSLKEKIIVCIISCLFTSIIMFAAAKSNILRRKADIEYVDKQDNQIKDNLKETKKDLEGDIKVIRESQVRTEENIIKILEKL